MTLTPIDKVLLLGVSQGMSASELAARVAAPEAWVRRRVEHLMRELSRSPTCAPPAVQTRRGPSCAANAPAGPHEKLRALLNLWNSRRGTRELPAHGALRLTDLQPWIENLLVIELVDRPTHPRIRIMGRAPMCFLDGDKTGRYVEEVVPVPAVAAAVDPYAACARRRRPHYDVLRSTRRGAEDLRFRRLLLPHSRNGRDVDIVLVAAYVERNREEMLPLSGVYELDLRALP